MGVDRFLARLTAFAGPFYEERSPAPDLAHVLACVWVRVVRLDGASDLTPIFPDGCADIMVYDDMPPRVAGPDATTRWAKLREGTVIAGVRIRPGAVRAIFGFPAGVILDQSALLSDLSPGAEALHQRLASTENLQARHSAIEDWIRNALASRTTRDREVIEACRLLTRDPSLGVSALATRYGWNERTLHRRFQAAVGYGPKHFSRILRVQKAIHAAAQHPTGRLAEVAQTAGYADQAHMTRDFRDITGFTPKNALQTAHPEVSSWMDVGW